MRLLFHRLLVAALLLAACAVPRNSDIPTPGPITNAASTPTTAPPAATATVAPTEAPTGALPATPSAPGAGTPAAGTPEAASDSIAHLAPGTAVSVTALAMLDPATGWAIGGTNSRADHVLRTTDGGETWVDVTPPEAARGGLDLGLTVDAHGFFPDAESAWVVYGVPDTTAPAAIRVWRTSNAGATWDSSEPIDASSLGVSDFFAPSDLHFVDAQHGWFLAHLGVGMNHDYFALYATSDGGATWAPVHDPQSGGPQSCGKTGVHFMDTQNGWLTGDCQGVAPGLFLYRSADGGATWEPAALSPPASAENIFTREDAGCGTNSLTFFDQQTAKLAVNCLILSTEPLENLAFVYTTNDGGASWASSPAPSRGLTFLDPQVGWSLPLTFGLDTPPFDLAATADGGATWTTVAQLDWYGPLDFVDPQAGWAVALTTNASRLMRTTDGGATWEALAPMIAP